jgi:hypothetical protein
MLRPGVLYEDLVWAQIRTGKIKDPAKSEQEVFANRMKNFITALPSNSS